MSSAAADFYLAGKASPPNNSAPSQGSPLHQYLYRRQVDSFGFLGAYIAKFAEWMAIPDDTLAGTRKRSFDEFEQVRVRLDEKEPVLLGLVYVSSANTLEIWKNHQVLAYDYVDTPGPTLDVKIYDPNFPSDDSCVIHCERVNLGAVTVPGVPPRSRTVFGFKCTERPSGRAGITVRGFFTMPYTPVVPPQGL